ncbi:MAG: hypothetical protein ACYCUM_03195 [Solirubrobacteraceae bacterium]
MEVAFGSVGAAVARWSPLLVGWRRLVGWPRLRGLGAAALAVVLLAGALHPRDARAAVPGVGVGLDGFAPLTSWQQPAVELPAPRPLDYLARAEAGVRQASNWQRRNWYCERLGCPGRWPMLTIWGEVPMFESVDALQLADPSVAHRALVERYAKASERYWDRYLRGYVPYPEDGYRHVEAYFDDNGWLGIAFLQGYRATGIRRYLHDAQRAFRFIASKGWDRAGGGMWWNTQHPYHSGPAIASDSLLGMLLYLADHERWQLQDVKTYVDWANANDVHDERGLYLEKPEAPESVIDYVQAPLIYAQYLLCKADAQPAYCEQAGRAAATIAEQGVNSYGYEYNYGPEYDTIFMQWMVAYGEATGEGYWRQLAEVNADAAEAHIEGGDGIWLGSWWGGPIKDPETQPDMFRTMAASTSLFAWLAYYAKPAG